MTAIVLGLLAACTVGGADRAIEYEHRLNGPIGVAIVTGEALHYEIIDGMAIHDGDMVLGTVEEVVEATRRWRFGKAVSGSFPERRSLSPEGGSYLWPDGMIPYEIEPGFTAKALQDIGAAIHEWNSRTVITLMERTTEPSYVHFRPSSSTPSSPSCSASVGYGDGARPVWLRDPEGCGISTAVHEIGHAVGLRHEHQRKDRDRHVQVPSRLRTGPSRYSYLSFRPIAGPYDYASVMHYRGGIESIPPGMPIRPSTWLSEGDIDGVARMYGTPPTATTVSTNPPGLEIVVDGERVVTPVAFEWEAGSTHLLQAPSPQSFGSERYVFGRWNDGGDSERTITAGPDGTWYEANFVVQKQFFTCAFPAGAGDVLVRPESDDGYHTLGSRIEFEAIPKPSGGLQFADWDWNNSVLPHGESQNPAWVASVSRSSSWTTYEARFKAEPFFVIDSDVERARIRVNGRLRALPYSIAAAENPQGISVEVPETISPRSGLRYRFDRWSDGGERNHRVDVPSGGGAVRLDVTREYLIYGRPIGRSDSDAALQITPQSEDGYYEEGTEVTLTAVPLDDRPLAGWVGDSPGTELAQTVRADAPRALFPVFAESRPVVQRESVAVTLASTSRIELYSRSGGYNVLVPRDAEELSVTFESATPGAEVDLYLALGREVAGLQSDDGKTLTILADFESKTAGASETITVNRSSIPPLLGEIYYIGLAVHPTQTEVQGVLSVEFRRSGITEASPAALTFISSNMNDPPHQTIRMSHHVTGPVRYRIASSLASVTVSPQEWVQMESGTAEIAVTVNSAGLEFGSHRGSLTVRRVSGDEMLPTGIEIPVLVGIIDASPSSRSDPRIGSVRVLSRPALGNTYAEGERIEVEVLFGEPIRVTGTPRMALTIGNQIRYADGVASSSNQCGGHERMLFRYEVRAEDVDADGIGIAADALTRNGGTIRSLAGEDANVDLRRHAIPAARGHKVDGSLVVGPRVTHVEIATWPQNGRAYGVGEWIRILVRFDRGIDVSGSPRLALTVGSQIQQAELYASGATFMWFRYAVQSGDTDSDGIGIAADALTLDGGTIQSRAGADAEINLGLQAIGNADGHVVDGSTPATLVVRRIRIHTTPQDGAAYGAGEEIGVWIEFTGPIKAYQGVTLDLDIGGHRRPAIFDWAGSSSVWFTYRVESSDRDTDGISIPADAVKMNKGIIWSLPGAKVDYGLGAHVIINAEEHRVRGGG